MDIFARNRDVSTVFLSNYNSNKDITTIVKKIQKVFFLQISVVFSARCDKTM